MTTTPQPPAGWYADQQQPGMERWFDGTQWTPTTRSAVPAPAPGGVVAPKKNRRKWPWVLLALLALFVLIVILIVASIGSAVKSATEDPHTVIYKVTSDGKTADITYLNINGDGTSGSAQVTDAPVPFTKTVTGKGDFSAFSLTAQAAQDASSVSCSITVDGIEKAQQTSSGEFAVVSCSADGS